MATTLTVLGMIRGDRERVLLAGLLDDNEQQTQYSADDVLVFTMKRDVADTDDDAIIQLISPAGIAISVGEDTAMVTIMPEDWDAQLPYLEDDLPFVWDVQMFPNGDAAATETLAIGTGIITADVTRLAALVAP